MITKQLLCFENKSEFYNWISKSDLYINDDEFDTESKESNTKKYKILKPVESITNYLELTNYLKCDTLQIIAWVFNTDDNKKAIQTTLILINSEILTK